MSIKRKPSHLGCKSLAVVVEEGEYHGRLGSRSIGDRLILGLAGVGIYEAEVMRGTVAKAIRKKTQQEWRRYLRGVRALGLVDRVALAWWILFGKQYQRR